MAMSPERRDELARAIAEAFDPDALERRVLRSMDTSWDQISGSNSSYMDRIYALITWAESAGQTEELVRSLYAANPNNPSLRSVAAAAGVVAATPDLVSLVRASLPPSGEQGWQLGLAEATRQVCILEHNGSTLGTGFLVGPDQIMTLSGILKANSQGGTQTVDDRNLTVTFDLSSEPYHVLAQPDFVSDGVAVLRLDRPAGREIASDQMSASSGRARGWVSLFRDSRLEQGVLMILQYVDKTGPRLSVDTEGLVDNDGFFLKYRNSTLTGAAGSPCFDVRWNLVGIHVGATSGSLNRGISQELIVEQLRKQGLVWDAVSGIHPKEERILESASAPSTALDTIVSNFKIPDVSYDAADDVWTDAVDDPSDPDRWAWAEAAAVTAYFDPQKLVPEGKPSLAKRVPILLNSSAVPGARGSTRWTLSQSVRVRALERLAKRKSLEAVRSKNPGDPAESADIALGQFIARIAPNRADLQDPDRLRAMLQVAGWLARTSIVPMPAAELRASLERATLIAPFRHLTQGFFAGRDKELQDLLSYVESPDEESSGDARAPLMLYGPGGMGKSSLLSHFILANSERDTMNPSTWRPFVYLDFDRPELDARDRIGLLLAIARQIGAQVPAVQQQAEELLQKWNARRRASRPREIDIGQTRGSRLANRVSEADVQELVVEVAKLCLAVHGAIPAPLLLVLDTVEEVQYATPDAVEPLAEMVIRLSAMAPCLRPVLSGRIEIGPPLKLTLKELGPLPQEAAEALLGNHLPAALASNAELLTRMVQKVGGNPLSLRLAAAALSQEDNLENMREEELWERVGDAIVQGQLYERIVGHLHEGPVKQLAIPGLVLRYITPALIREVLAGPCGLGEMDDASAQALFDELADETALVRQGIDNTRLVLRAELRRTVLDNFRRDSRSATQRIQIHQAAVTYFASGTGPENRAEEIYHRLWLDQDPPKIEARWLPGVEIPLRSAVEELDGRARVFLANRVGGVDDAAVARSASAGEWEVYAEKRASNLLKLDSAAAALDVLNLRQERSSTSRLYLIESIARRSLPEPDREGAEIAAEKAVASARARNDPGELRSALQELVVIKRMRYDTSGALSVLAELAGLGQQLGEDLVLLQANVGGLEAHLANEDANQLLSDSTLRVFGRLPDELVTRAPELARRVGAELGGRDPSTLQRVIRLVGPGTFDQEAAKELQEVLGSWAQQRPEIRSFIPARGASSQQLASALQYLLANHSVDSTIARRLADWLRGTLKTPPPAGSERAYSRGDFTDNRAQCDIVMKGGITSGVVYPLALVELAKKYRFANIGGTSAGAIAAAAAAAGEYGRQTAGAGFERLAKVPEEVGPNLLSMFQPTPTLRPLFDIFLALLKGKGRIGAISEAVIGYSPSGLLGLFPGIIAIGLARWFDGGWGFVAFGVLLALVGLIGAVVWRLLRAVNTDLVANDFGLCPGIRQSQSAAEGFTDWLARLIQEAAGRPSGDDPLTFGDLATPPNGAPPIRLAMITTSLMEERPYTLPLENDRRFVFRQDEWEKIFPASIIAFLVRVCDPFKPTEGEPGDFFYFPDPARLPLIVGARMSLSFPGLISGVPLWRRDFTLIHPADQNKLQRCLFSDGGLSSNFPIHFFDHLLPNSPTFAISLDDYDPKRNYDSVWLPAAAASGTQLPVLPFSGLGGFLARLLFSAKDWQDNLQSTLPGYRERIVHVVLKPDEGGLNLTMSAATVQKLVRYGEQAGIKLRDEFDLDAHRWRRFLVAMARMEQTLDEVATAYEQVPGQFGDFLAVYSQDPSSYKQTAAETAEMLKRGAELSTLGRRWRTSPTIGEGKIPKPETNLRITPKY